MTQELRFKLSDEQYMLIQVTQSNVDTVLVQVSIPDGMDGVRVQVAESSDAVRLAQNPDARLYVLDPYVETENRIAHFVRE